MDKFVHANNLNLHYLDHAGGEPVVVLLHGLTANAHAFDGLVAAGLCPRYHVLALDLRGRGLSDKPATGYSIGEHAADVVNLLDALNLPQVILGGHSYGGLLGLYMAARHPERVARLVVMDAALASAHPSVRDLIKPSLERLGRVLPSWEVYLQAMKQAPFFDGWWDPFIENYYRADVQTHEDGSVQARTRPAIIGKVMDQVVTEDWPAIVASVRQPTLLLNATGPYGPPGAPPIVSREQAEETAAALNLASGSCRYVHVPGNHMTMLFGENAKHMAALIAEFLEQPE